MARQQEYVLRTIEERGIRFIRLWFTDVLGQLKSVSITPQELETAFEEGMSFDGSAVDGFSRVHEADMLAKPDPTTFAILPWSPKDHGVARMICDILNPDGTPFEGCPRYVLRRNLERAAVRGFTFYCGPEIEHFYFASTDFPPQPLDTAGYFDHTPLDVARDFRRQTILALEQMGIPVKYSHHEVAPSQHEIDLRHTDALTMADTIMTYRLVVKEVAMEAGIHATFMPKPIEGVNGSALHTHQSLFEGEQNAFFDPGDELHLSKAARGYIAGLLSHAREFTAVTNQWVNSYKRIVLAPPGRPSYEAPVYICWGRRNQSALVRVPTAKPGKEQSCRVELRSPDPACNPYLAFSVMLAAGLKGIEDDYQLPPEALDNIYEMTDSERRAAGIGTLPQSLDQALRDMERSELVAEALGEHVFGWFLRNKWDEWNEYRTHVSEWELSRYFRTL